MSDRVQGLVCPGCGAPAEFPSGALSGRCSYCGTRLAVPPSLEEPARLAALAAQAETLGRHDDAEGAWRRLLELDPTNPLAWAGSAFAAAMRLDGPSWTEREFAASCRHALNLAGGAPAVRAILDRQLESVVERGHALARATAVAYPDVVMAWRVYVRRCAILAGLAGELASSEASSIRERVGQIAEGCLWPTDLRQPAWAGDDQLSCACRACARARLIVDARTQLIRCPTCGVYEAADVVGFEVLRSDLTVLARGYDASARKAGEGASVRGERFRLAHHRPRGISGRFVEGLFDAFGSPPERILREE